MIILFYAQQTLSEAEQILNEECSEWASRSYSVRSDVGSLPLETLVAHHGGLWIGYRPDNQKAPGLHFNLKDVIPNVLVYKAGGGFVPPT